MSNANSTGQFTAAYLDQLLREGIAAAKIDDKEMARTKLRQVTELDQYNEKAWFWLASVVETDEEKRVCLGNVVVINPNNDRAKQLLDQLIAGGGSVKRDDGGAGRMTIKELIRIFLTLPPPQRLIVAAGGIVALGLCLLISSSISQPAALGQPTIANVGATDVPPLGGGANDGTTVAQGPTEIPPTATLTPLALPSLPPSWTPEPSATPNTGIKSTPLAAPPADVLSGRMLVSIGTALTLDQALPISLYLPKTGAITPIIDRSNRGDWAEFMPDGRRVIYARYISGTNSQQIRIVNLNGTQGRELSEVWGNKPNLADHKMVSVSDNGKVVAFSAINKPENDASPDIYWIAVEFGLPQTPTPVVPTEVIPATNTLLPVPTEVVTLDPNATIIPVTPTETATETATVTETATDTPGPTPTEAKAPLNRLTEKDSGENVWPSVSPDGTQVVYVSNRQLYGQGVDLYLVPVGAAAPEVNLSNDADALIEAAPRWSPDGKQIAFQAGTVDAKGNFMRSSIYVMNADGSERVELVGGESVNMRPVWSPDGAYIAFTSNRSGKNEIFVVNVASKELFQVTSMPDAIVLQDWRP
ncbi:MAG: PD40 domain-containing protein [Anaerolineae bacterium]|nr:PD40 domain-containing protein [Anaerolineae bacterium]